MARRLLLLLAVGELHIGNALAQQPVQPSPMVGGCPLCYYASGSYCLQSSSGSTRDAIEGPAALARWASIHPATPTTGLAQLRQLLRQKPLIAKAWATYS